MYGGTVDTTGAVGFVFKNNYYSYTNRYKYVLMSLYTFILRFMAVKTFYAGRGGDTLSDSGAGYLLAC